MPRPLLLKCCQVIVEKWLKLRLKMEKILITTKSQFEYLKRNREEQIWLGPWVSPDDFRESREGSPDVHRHYAPTHGLNEYEYHFGVQLLDKVYKNILMKFSQALNKIHGVDEPLRYWEIIIGQWVYCATTTILEKILHLEKLSESYADIQMKHPSLTPSNEIYKNEYEHDFIYRTTEPEWMGSVYTEIIDTHPLKNITNTEFRTVKNVNIPEELKNISSLRSRIIKKMISRCLQWFHKDAKYFLYETNMPLKSEFISNMYLSQWPIRWHAPKYQTHIKCLDADMRSKLLYEDYDTIYERSVVKIIANHIPMAYLENYNEIKHIAMTNRSWPKNPDVIFTSVGFSGFEYFKIWTAEKVKRGAAYIISQHGNNYGTNLEALNFPEMVVPDGFISWGWELNNKVIRGQNFLTRRPKRPTKRTHDTRPIILIITKSHGDNYAIYGKSHDYIDQVHNIKTILTNLASKKDKYDILVKRHNNKRGFDLYNEIESHATLLGISLLKDNGEKFYKLFEQNIYLIIFTYDSTGFYESLAFNKPTVCVTSDHSYRVSPNARDDYRRLAETNVMCEARYFDDYVASYLDSVHEWWNSIATQGAVNDFARKYCSIPKNQAKSLAIMLRNIRLNNGKAKSSRV